MNYEDFHLWLFMAFQLDILILPDITDRYILHYKYNPLFYYQKVMLYTNKKVFKMYIYNVRLKLKCARATKYFKENKN